MSQGDYIRLKQLKTRLIKNDLAPILSSQDYTDFASFSVASTVINTIPTDNCLDVSGVYIFDILQTCDSLPEFILCNGTDGRENRVLNPDPNFTNECSHVFYPMTQKQKDLAQCHTGCPYNTTLAGYPLKWPGDNRVKPVGNRYNVGWRYR